MPVHLKFSLLGVLLAGFLCFAIPSHVVQAASYPCNVVNGHTFGPVTMSAGFLPFADPFDIGDTLTVTHTGTAAQATLEIPSGTAVATIPQGGSVTITITTAGITNFRIVNLTGSGNIAGTITCGDAPAASSTSNAEVPFTPGDGRINQHVADRAAPVALYCLNDGIQAIRIDPVTGNGEAVIRVSASELEAAGLPLEGNIILAQTEWVILSRLPGGRFQANAWYPDGKPYTVTWIDCNGSDNIYLER